MPKFEFKPLQGTAASINLAESNIKNLLTSILFTFGLCFYAHSQQEAYLRHYGVKEGIANSTVYYSMQDSRGFLWFCTETGVNRFDGHQFETFTLENGLADNTNFKCVEDSRGRVWFLSFNGRLCYFLNERFYTEESDNSLQFKSGGSFLFDLQEDESGGIWFSTSAGLYIYDGAAVRKVREPGNTYIPNNVTLTKRDGLLTRFRIKIEKRVVTPYFLNIKIPMGKSLKVSRKITGMPYADSSVIPMRHTSQIIEKSQIAYISKHYLLAYNEDSLRVLLSDRDLGIYDDFTSFYYDCGTLWLGTFNNGLYKIEDPFSPKRNISRVFKNAIITSILKDSEGNFWFSSREDGIFFMSKNARAFTRIEPFFIPTRHSFYSVAVTDSPFCMAAGTSDGSIVLFDSSRHSRTFKVPNPGPLNRVLNLRFIDHRHLLIGSDHGTAIMDVSTGKHKIWIPDLTAKKVDVKNKTILLAGAYLISRISEEGKLDTISYDEKSSSVALLNDSVFYFGVKSGLYKYHSSGHKKELLYKEPFFKTLIYNLVVENNKLWAGTNGNGVFIFRNDSLLSQLTVADGLPSNTAQQLRSDGNGNIWLATNNGIAVIDAATRRVIYAIDSKNGLSTSDVKDIAFYKNRAYLASPSGLTAFSLADLDFSSSPPPTYFTKVSFLDTVIPSPRHIAFDYFKGFLTISFTSISFASPPDILYQYRASEKENWIQTKAGNITLFAPEPGTYVIELRAKKNNSTWSKPVLLSVTVYPRFWQTWWFRGTIVLTVLLTGIFLTRKRIAAVRMREREKNAISSQIAELERKALVNQMNPHFIFNSLNTVQDMILLKDQASALNYLTDFAQLMRGILNNSRKPNIPLSEEIAFIHQYLKLEIIRYNNSFNYTLHVDPELHPDEIVLPPMLIQPIVENAVKHGLPATVGGEEAIKIQIGESDGMLNISVEDFGNGMSTSIDPAKKVTVKHESAAISVIKERLTFMRSVHGQAGKLIITDKTAHGGTGIKVEIYIPVNNH